MGNTVGCVIVFKTKRSLIMEKIIPEIIEIEDKAKKLVEDAHNEEDAIFKAMEEEIVKMKARINEMTESKIKQISERNHKEAQEKINRIWTDTAKKLLCLEEWNQANTDKWIETVFSNVIGG